MSFSFANDLTIEEVRLAIAHQNALLPSPGFYEAERGDIIIFNYAVAFANSFPEFTGDAVEDRRASVLRECRGLTFCAHTGKVLARKFSKFFNVNERPDVQIHLIDWTRPHHILTKLDGSMITPVLIDDELQWHTKMGATDVAVPAATFARQNPAYEAFARSLIADGYTPNAEWTSNKQRIVLSYPEDNIVFTAARENRSGEYMPYADLRSRGAAHGVPVVEALSSTVDDIESFIAEARELKDAEGYVIAFTNGERYKVKADDYVRVHRAKDALLLEKNVVAIIVNNQVDDFLALLPENDRAALTQFQEKVEVGLARSGDEIASNVADIKSRMTKKEFALTLAKNYPRTASFIFSVWDGQNAADVLRNHVIKNIGSQTRIDEVRHLWGTARWTYGVVTGD